MEALQRNLGIIELPIDGIDRTIKFNPSDMGFLMQLYGMAMKADDIAKEYDGPVKSARGDALKMYEITTERDNKLRVVVDEVFGDGFCRDYFETVSLTAGTEDGMTVLEKFIFSLIDRMDDDVKERLKKRDATIAKYTAKYDKNGKYKK